MNREVRLKHVLYAVLVIALVALIAEHISWRLEIQENQRILFSNDRNIVRLLGARPRI